MALVAAVLAAAISSFERPDYGEPAPPQVPTASPSRHPRCGRLTVAEARDADSICVQFVHAAQSVGELRLLNTSSSGTIASELPRSVVSNIAAWWAMRDGISWDALAGAGRGSVQPFGFTAWYRGHCAGSSCPSGSTNEYYYDVRVDVTLRARGKTAPMLGEHTVSIRAYRSSSALPALHVAAQWTPCFLLATVTIGNAATGVDMGSGESADATRPMNVSDEHSLWCADAESVSHLELLLGAEDRAGELGSSASIVLKEEADVCEQLLQARAVNAVHIRYFLDQQEQERRLLQSVERDLCAPPRPGTESLPDEALYQSRLQAALAPYRMSTRLHLYTAFVAKSVCSHNSAVDRQRAIEQSREGMLQLPTYAAGYFSLRQPPGSELLSWLARHNRSAEAAALQGRGNGRGGGGGGDGEPGRNTWLHLLSPYTHETNASIAGHRLWTRAPLASVDPAYLPNQPDPESDFCPLPILHHERFNTMESWYVWNFTSHLLRRGAAFCAAPPSARRALLGAWRSGLEDVMRSHRGNNAFLVYSDVYEAACQRVQANADERVVPMRMWAERAERAAFRGADWRTFIGEQQKVVEDNLVEEVEAIRQRGECSKVGVTTAGLISAFGNDTEIALAMGKALLVRGLGRDKLMDGRSGPSECVNALPAARRRAIADEIGPLAAEERVFRHGHFMTKWGAWSLTLATAYHKLVPICEPADPQYKQLEPYNWQCDTEPMPAEPDGKIVYDLVPLDEARGYCYGEHCTSAVLAIDALRRFLHPFSAFRTRVVHAMLSGTCPYDEQQAEDGEVVDGAGGGSFLRELKNLNAALPALMRDLRAAQPGLAATCFAPTRSDIETQRQNWGQALRMSRFFQEKAEMQTSHDSTPLQTTAALLPQQVEASLSSRAVDASPNVAAIGPAVDMGEQEGRGGAAVFEEAEPELLAIGLAVGCLCCGCVCALLIRFCASCSGRQCLEFIRGEEASPESDGTDAKPLSGTRTIADIEKRIDELEALIDPR